MDDMRRDYIKEKGYKVEEMWDCDWWESFKTDDKIKNHVRTHFPYKRPLSTDSLLAKIKDWSLFGNVQCYLVVPDELKSKFAIFPPIFKNTEVGRDDIGDYMKNYAIENEMLKHPQRMLISSFKLENGTVITPLFNFYMELGLQCTKIYRFVQYSPRKCFNSFVQSVVDSRREGDENPLSGVVAETMKLLGNSSHGYQIMDRSRQNIWTMKKPIRQSMNHCLRDLIQLRRTYMRWSYWSQPLSTENPSLLVFSYFSMQNWQYWSSTITSLTNSAMWIKLKRWRWTHTHFTWHLLKRIYTTVSNQIRELIWKNDCRDSFKADAKSNFFPRTCCSTHKKYDKREPGLFKEEFKCTEMLCLCSKTYSCYDNKSDKFKFSSKGLNKRVLEDSGDGSMSKYRRVLDEAINLTSTNRGFRIKNHMVATYEQTKKGLGNF